MSGRKSSLTALALAALTLVVLAVFAPSLHSDLVYDSGEEILQWDFLHDPRNIPAALTFQIMGMDVLDFNRPVAVTSLMFDSVLWGKQPFGYHLTNILLHAATICLVFLLIRHILFQTGAGRDPRWKNLVAFLAALLFAVHPLVTEAVCEPSYRKDLLAALFGLAALLVATRHSPTTRNGDITRIFLCPFLCLLAVGSKEVGVAFPAILFLYWLLFRRNEPKKFWACTLLASTVVVVLFLVARFVLAHVPSEIFIVQPTYPADTLAGTLLIQPRILALYLVNILWPLYLCADYNSYSVRFLPLTLSLFLLAGITALIGWWSTKDRRVLFGAGFVAAAILPVCNLVPIYHPAADRYLYVPLIGVALLVALALDHAWLAQKFSRQATATILVLLLAAFLIPVTLGREKVWSSELTLWQNTLERNPRSFPARINLPEALLKANRLQEAKTQFEATLQTPYATYPWLWFDYAIELDRLGDRPAAERAARRAIELQPDIADADKMVRTLQCPRDLADEFARLAASLPRRAP